MSVSAQHRIRNALDSLQKVYPREKVFILLNKAEYIAGETMWFSVFTLYDYNLSPFSTNVYVELYDNQKKLLSFTQLPLFNGQASGQLPLSEKLNEDVYFIRAYTQWMLNFPEDGQYIHAVFVRNPKSAKKLQLQNLQWTAEAFPEGGQLIDQISSRIAVRLFSTSPLPQNWSGYITETGGSQKIAEFTSMDRNVAIARLLPFTGHHYQLTVQDETGAKQTISLPPVASAGVHLEVNNLYDSIEYIIRFKNVSGAGSGYKLVGTINDQLVYEASIRKSDSVLKRFIPTSSFFNGILRLTVFDAQENAISERLCFLNAMALQTKTGVFSDKEINSAPRSLNILKLQSDTLENPYSIVVLDAAAKDPMEEDNFLSALWLSGDLSKPIERPAQYFTHVNTRSAEALDAVLISEATKSFNWNEVLSNNFPSIKYLPDNYISYKGTVFKNKKPVANETVNLIFDFPDSSKQFLQATTDAAGRFDMPHLFFYDSAKVYYQLNQKKEAAKNITIQLERLNKPTPYHLSLPSTPYSLVDRPVNDQNSDIITRAVMALNNQTVIDHRYKVLEEAKVQARIKTAAQKLDEQLSSGAFRGFNETLFDFVNQDQHAEGYTNILQWLQGRVAGLQVGADLFPIIRGNQINIYLDEMQVDPSMLTGLPANDIALIKVVKGFFVGGPGGGNGGAVLVYTKRGGTGRTRHTLSLPHALLTGYDKPEKFPLPDYNESVYRQIKKDTRDVLFWNGLAVSENDQLKVPIRFYNNDRAKEFRVIVVGFTIDGEPIYFNDILK